MLKRIIQIVGVLLLAYLAWKRVDFGELKAALASLTVLAAIFLLLAATLDRLVMAFKWRHLAAAIDLRISAGESTAMYYASSFLSYFLPTALGGDVYRGVRVAQITGNPAGATAAIVAEKIVGVLATISFAWAGLVYLLVSGVAPESMRVFWLVLAASIAAFAAFVLSLSPRLHAPLLKLFGKSKLAGPLTKLSSSYASFGEARSTLFVNFLMSVFENGLQLTIFLVASRALGIDAPPVAFVAIAAVSLFLMRVSMVLDGWGISEAIRIITYGLIGISTTDAFAIAIVAHTAMAAASLPGAYVFFTQPIRSNPFSREEPDTQ